MKRNKNGLQSQYQAVVIGVSSGGMEVLQVILQSLPADFSLPIIIVQHLHADSDNYLARSLDEKCRLSVREACEKEEIKPGVVYIAPPNYHLLIENDQSFSLTISERVNFARPSIDVLFETAADVYGAKLIGIVLTGANYDGSQGLKNIKECGGVAIVQDPTTAQVDSMPKEAIAVTTVDYVLPPVQVGPTLVQLAKVQGTKVVDNDS